MSKVLVTGVSVIDFIFKLEQMPQEPEKFRAEEAVISGGGVAANAAVAISKLGGEATLVSRIGKDDIGCMIKKQLIKEGVRTENIEEYRNCRSSFSSVYIDSQGERQIVNFRDRTLPDDASWIRNIEEHKAYLVDTRWNAGAIETLKIAKNFKRPGVLDAEDTVTAEALKLASHAAFSFHGLRHFTKQTDVKKALSQVTKFTEAWVCVTDGERGVYILNNNELKNIPALQVEVEETLGAGDVWHGAFALSLAEGEKELEAVKFANSVASLKCKKFGGRDSFPNRQQVQEFIREHQ
ncbi:MAG: PfkB family carbohydrate kinase [Pseudomonadota bacterium]|nr:PfkB family carbohydrate kinase [Pseudomonadota bacterium]